MIQVPVKPATPPPFLQPDTEVSVPHQRSPHSDQQALQSTPVLQLATAVISSTALLLLLAALLVIVLRKWRWRRNAAHKVLTRCLTDTRDTYVL